MTRVVAVVTAHNPDERLLTLIREVGRQAATVVVVDDGSTTGLDVLETVGTEPHTQLRRQANVGVAAALNAGVAAADALGADAVLTLDQDSGLPPDYVAAAVAAWQTAVTRGIPVAFVSAATYGGRLAPTRGTTGGFHIAFDPMQSGSLVPTATYARVGGYDEPLVIDAVDSELTVRCLAAGLVPVVGPGCHLEHGMGDRRRTGRLGYNHHSPERVYYMARNGTLLTRRYARRQPGWVARRLLEEAKAHTLRLALDPERTALARAAAQGLRDGLRGRTGRR